MENNLPSILGGMAQGFTDFGKGLFDMFGTGGASVLDLIESAKTGNVTNRRQDDFRKWLYQTDSTKDAAAKGLGTALNGVQTVADYIPGVNALTQTTLGNAAQGALGGLADELKTYGEDYDLGRAGKRAAISAAGAAVSGGLADALKGSNNALLSSNAVRGLARGATGGAITGGGYAAIDGGNVLEAAKQGAGMGALIGGATGAFQDFAPRKSTYNAAMTDEQRQARIANIDDQLSKLDTSTPEGNARYNELMNARDNYADNRQAQFDLLQKTNPMRDDYHTGIRSPEDIYTLKSIVDSYNADNNFTYPDFTLADAQKALARGNIDVYGSKPIETGAFISPSKMMATDYAGGGEVYTKNIPLRDFAFIESGDEGNYLPTARALETTLSDADMAVNSQTKGLGGSPDGAQNYRTFATGDEAREYFGNSNPGYWDKAPGYDDIQEYTRNGYSRVNDMLRTGQDNYGYPDTDIMIDNIERGIDGYDLKDDIKVYRKSNADVYKNLKVGDTFTDDGFTSASVTPEIGGDFGKANIEIDVGKGKGVGAFIGDLSSGYGDEGEFLLQRGTKYKVVGKDGDRLKLEVVGNERKPLEQILANQDLSVNSAKIAPGQLGLFDDMPTQTPKTGTRQTSLFDQPDNPYLDYYGADIDTTPLAPETPANPYAPVNGEVTQAMRDRASDILGNWKKNGVPENELYNAINQDTLPDKVKSLKEIVDGGAYDKRMKELFGTTDIKKADIGKVIDYLYESEPARADNIKNNLLAERGLGKYEQRFRNRMKKSLYEAAQERIANDIGANGLASSKNIADVSIRRGYTAAADEALSERLGIAPGNTPKYNGAMDTRNAYGRYSHPSYREGGDLAVFERKMNDPEDAISTVAHERLHSFQGELEPRSKGRYDKEVLEAYEQLRNDLAPHYKSWDETAERYGHRGTGYWQSTGEQESRMLQNYLENKGYTDSTHMKSQYRAGEWGNEINPAFDKFFDKLRDLSKRGVALPALAALFGGGAYMASQENDEDKEKEVK